MAAPPKKKKKEYKVWDLMVKMSKHKNAKWVPIGVITEDVQTGLIGVKINFVPTAWNGWATAFERKVQGPFDQADDGKNE